jgi:hypothetical protein
MDISGQKFTISGTEKAKIGSLYAELRGRLERPGNSYDKLVLQVGSPVVYDTVMQVLHMCSQLQYHDGKQLQKLTKLTFVELPIKKPGKK